jgi:hypothetical protein
MASQMNGNAGTRGKAQQNGDATPLAVVDEYEKLPGVSNARYVLAEDGREYVMKGPSLSPNNPLVAANEWVAARLVEALGLPILDHRILKKGRDLFFGSAYMQAGSYSDFLTAQLFAKCDNRDDIYAIVAFDIWLINHDRHNQNLIVRHFRKPKPPNQLFPNDHSHLLVNESPDAPRRSADLMGCLDDPPARFVTLSFVRDSIVNAEMLSAAITRIEVLPEQMIRSAVASTPNALLPPADRAIYADFLVRRRRKLKRVVQNGRRAFPKLEGSL